MNSYSSGNRDVPCIMEKLGKITGVNNAFCELTGYPPDELLGQTTEEVWSHLLRMDVCLPYTGSKARDYLFTKSLDARYVEIKRLKRNVNGEAPYLVSEIPGSRFEDKNQFVEKIISDNAMGVAVYSAPDLRLIKSNQAYLGCLPLPDNSKEYLYGKRLKDFVPDFEGSVMEQGVKAAVNESQSVYSKDFNGFVSTGKSRYSDITLIPVSENGRVTYLVLMLDRVTEYAFGRSAAGNQSHLSGQRTRKLTGRKRAHANQSRRHMLSENKKLEAVIGNMCEALAVIDKSGRLILANEAAKSIMSSGAWMNYYYEDGSQLYPRDFLPSIILRGEKITKKRYVDKSDPCEKYGEFSATPVFDENGELYFCILMSHDITELIQKDRAIKEQDEMLIEAEKEKLEALENAIKLKDEFLYLITHEFKTPIAVIRSALQTIDRLYKQQMPEKSNKLLNCIRQNTNRELRLVNNLLDITRINAGHLNVYMTNTDIVPLTRSITESIKDFAEQKGIALSFSSTLTKKIIGIDTEKYERILLNLLSNALKCTPRGKAISVGVSQKIIGGRSKVCIQVKDKGIGIPKDKTEFIFERFGQVDSSLTRQAEGSGIGLHLVRMLVELLDGEITLHSIEGRGSTFTILLPATKVKKEDPREAMMKENSENRLIEATAIEFSDIYI